MLASTCRLALVLAVSYVLSAAVFGGWSLLACMSKAPNILTVIFAVGNFIEFLRTGGQPGDWLKGTKGSTQENRDWQVFANMGK